MRITNFIVAIVFAMIAIAGNRVLAQAHVSENESAYVYVDAYHGSDSHTGATASQPVRTLASAVAKAEADNRRGVGTKVLINPGVYHESVVVNSTYGRTSAPITFQAVRTGTAIITGSDALTGWYHLSSTVYGHHWVDPVGPCGEPGGWPAGAQPITLRREMVFVNGTALTQVMSASQLRVGTFYVNSGSQLLEVWPAPYNNMSTADVEVADRPNTLTVTNQRNMVFRGLVLEHGATCMNQSAANVYNGSNILFDSVQANWNNWGGLNISGTTNFTVENSVASYNGGIGFIASNSRNALYQNAEADFNNWRGAMGGFYNWAMGGTKFWGLHGATFNNLYSYNNAGQGLWFDTDNENITVNNAVLSQNIMANMQIEASEGPITVKNSSVCYGGLGIDILESSNVNLTGNNLYQNSGLTNGQTQLMIAGNQRYITNWETHASTLVRTANTTLQSNTIVGSNSQQFLFKTWISGSQWSTFANSLHSNYNHWYNASKPSAFSVNNGRIENINGWRSVTGQDYGSSWTSSSIAARSCGVPNPSYPDFYIYAGSVSTSLAPYYMSGYQVKIPVQVKSFGAGAGTVSLSVSGLPSGVTAYFSPAYLTNGYSTLTIKAATWARRGTVPITIFGVHGYRTHAVTLPVYVD